MTTKHDPANPSQADRDLAAGFGPDFQADVDAAMHADKLADAFTERHNRRAQQLEHRQRDVDRVIGTFNAQGGW